MSFAATPPSGKAKKVGSQRSAIFQVFVVAWRSRTVTVCSS
jgi:hypothetical protein